MGTCARRQVGCVLVDSSNFPLSDGFNGVPTKFPHCRENPGHECPGAGASSGKDLDSCYAVHAEINALIHCPDPSRVRTAYCTTSPCIQCIKALLCSGATRIVFIVEYPHYESRDLWVRYPGANLPRTWEQIQPDGTTKVLASSEWKVN
jgi:dCMP deaminase